MQVYQGRDHNAAARLGWWKDRYGERLLSDFTSDTAREALAKMEVEPAARGPNAINENCKPRSGPTINRYRSALSACFKPASIDLVALGRTQSAIFRARLLGNQGKLVSGWVAY